MAEPVIRAAGLTKRFGAFTAVDELSIEVAKGTIYAFLGANGSGKSTTIRMLIGVLRPTAGTIEVDGVDVIKHPRRVRDRIGYMGQKVSLYQGLSLRENVEFYGGLYGLANHDLDRRWSELRERFALGEAENEQSQDLPAGIRQRAGLALATLHAPRVLFLDEPTAGVDVASRGLFWELIHDEAASGVTVFVTTHFLEEVDYCDWVAFIDAGHLIANATPEDLRARHSEGYRIELDVSPALGDAAAKALAATGAVIERTPSGLHAVAPVLSRELLTEVQRLADLDESARIHIAQAPMTDVFRRVLEKSARSGPASRSVAAKAREAAQ